MKIVLLYEDKLNREKLTKQIETAGHDITLCTTSGNFMEAVYENSADLYIIDVKSWFRGSSIYNYYNVPVKLSGVRSIFFNTPEGFTSVEGRESMDVDSIIENDGALEKIIAAVA